MKHYHSLPLIAAILCAGCDDLLGGGEKPPVAISGGTQQNLASPLTLRTEVGGRRAEVSISVIFDEAMPLRIHAPRTGDVPVQVRLLTQGGTLLASVDFEQEFVADHEHWVRGVVGDSRPIMVCSTGEVIAVPLPASAEVDSLFVVHGVESPDPIC